MLRRASTRVSRACSGTASRLTPSLRVDALAAAAAPRALALQPPPHPAWWPAVGGASAFSPLSQPPALVPPPPPALDVVRLPPPQPSEPLVVGTILGTARVANLAARRGACADLNVCARHAGLALELELPGAPSAMDEVIQAMPKRTFQPNRLKRKRTHGFLKCVPASHGTVARRTAPT